MKDKKLLSYFVLALAGLFMLLLIFVQTNYKNNHANIETFYSENGVFDLRDFDFSSGMARLHGDVEHIEGQLLTPEEFEERENEAVIGNPVDEDNFRTARFTVLTPDDGDYTFSIWGDYARSYYVNGELIENVGTVADNAEDFEAGYKVVIKEVTATDSELEFVVQGGNFVHREGSWYTNVHLGELDLVKWYHDFDIVLVAITSGMFFCMFLVYFTMGAITKSYDINIDFSLLSLTWCLRQGFAGEKFLFTLFPDLPWELAFRLEYITFALTVVFLSRITAYHLKDYLNTLVMRIFTYVFIVKVIFFTFLETKLMTEIISVSTFLYIMMIGYISVSFIYSLVFRKVKKEIDLAKSIVIMGMFILFVCAINDGLYYLNIHIAGTTMLDAGIIVFVLYEAIAIFYINMQKLERIESEERMMRIRAQELERFTNMRSHFIGIVAHEIKTPLAIIMSSAGDTLDIIESENFSYKSEIESNQLLIKDTVKKVNETVFDLLDMSALETGRFSLSLHKTNLKELITSVTEQYKFQIEESKNRLVLDFDKFATEVLADEKRLRQVFLNILSNSCRHTQNATITISIKNEKDYLRISFIDEGEGMTEDILAKLKNGYIDDGPHGYRGGIGLYVCNQIIRAHEGVFEIESKEKVGTTITVKLPKERLVKYD